MFLRCGNAVWSQRPVRLLHRACTANANTWMATSQCSINGESPGHVKTGRANGLVTGRSLHFAHVLPICLLGPPVCIQKPAERAAGWPGPGPGSSRRLWQVPFNRTSTSSEVYMHLATGQHAATQSLDHSNALEASSFYPRSCCSTEGN